MRMLDRVRSTSAHPATILIRLVVGGVFLSEGIQKFLFPAALGVGRFVKIGIPAPEVMAPFVGVVEIVGGADATGWPTDAPGRDPVDHRHAGSHRHD